MFPTSMANAIYERNQAKKIVISAKKFMSDDANIVKWFSSLGQYVVIVPIRHSIHIYELNVIFLSLVLTSQCRMSILGIFPHRCDLNKQEVFALKIPENLNHWIYNYRIV